MIKMINQTRLVDYQELTDHCYYSRLYSVSSPLDQFTMQDKW